VILLVTPLPAARDCCARLQQATEEPVFTAQNFLEALARLRTAPYTLVVFDRHLVEAEPNEFLTTFSHLGDAVLLEINFALTGIDRLMHEVQAALQRREHNLTAVHAAAARALQNEFSENLTALLLDCDLAVNLPGLPPAAANKLSSIQRTVENLRNQLAHSAAAGG
jgi:CheY-like chemotaxis protein